MDKRTQLDFRNVNSLWASVAVETLARAGVRHAVISPGSRSTPLALQFARCRDIEAIPVLDERSAAFFAIGLARQSRRPVVLLCTSGTAGANYFPAVIEARESEVPLLVLTADRPPEMRQCRSGQTIDQQKLFGSYVRHYHELAVPEAAPGLLRYLRQTVADAVHRSILPQRGPVHLNVPFRDPLPPIPSGKDFTALEEQLGDENFFSYVRPPVHSPAAAESDAAALRLPSRGIIVAGQARPSSPQEYAQAVGAMAERLGWPVLADALSPLRNFKREVPGLVTSYDSFLRAPETAGLLHTAHVICLHDWPTSKVLRGWLEELDARVTFVSSRDDNPDALHLATYTVREDVETFCRMVPAGERDPGWQQTWSALEAKGATAIARGIESSHENFEGRVAALLPTTLAPGAVVMVANSMPVRDLEYFWPANDGHHVVHCNRGANGIDGTLSTALGLAHGGRPTILLTGDLAFLHDSNGLLIAPKFRGSLTVVLINNHGGGIFEHLPVAAFDPPFEEFFATPQSVDFGRLCAAHGLAHRQLSNIGELVEALQGPKQGVRVLEFRTDRKKDAAFRKKLFAEIAAACTA